MVFPSSGMTPARKEIPYEPKAPASESMVAAGIHSPALRARIRLARIFVAGVIGEGKWRRSPDKGDDAPKSHGVHLAVGWRHGSAASSVRAPLRLPEPGHGGRCPRPGARAGTPHVGASLFVVSGSGLGIATDSVATHSPRQRRPPTRHSQPLARTRTRAHRRALFLICWLSRGTRRTRKSRVR